MNTTCAEISAIPGRTERVAFGEVLAFPGLLDIYERDPDAFGKLNDGF